MSAVAMNNISKKEHDELCCSYAAMILHDGGVSISADKMSRVISASGNAVEGYWPGLFAKALVGQDITTLMRNVGAPAAPAQAVQADAVAEAVDEVVAKEEENEEEIDMCDMFDCGDEEY